MKKVLIFAAIFIFAVSSFGISSAQDLSVLGKEDFSTQEGSKKKGSGKFFAYGEVLEIDRSARRIMIQLFKEGEESKTVTFSVDPGVEVENEFSWYNIPVKRDVEVEYVEVRGKKVIKYIYVYSF